ncbi:MAG: large subunit ribosomal protein L10 [Flavobacteriaceae bacterium]|jgi:large subunit ribosomal protein L10
MAITKAKKKEIISGLEKGMADATSVVFVNFNGLTVGKATEIRRTLQEQGISYRVAKKTLIGRALDSKGYEGSMPEMPGNIALAWSNDDPTAPAREIFEFHKKNKKSMSIVGGVFENRYRTMEEMNDIAQIPDLQTLRGMFVNVINSPIQGLAVALGQIAQKRA